MFPLHNLARNGLIKFILLFTGSDMPCTKHNLDAHSLCSRAFHAQITWADGRVCYCSSPMLPYDPTLDLLLLSNFGEFNLNFISYHCLLFHIINKFIIRDFWETWLYFSRLILRYIQLPMRHETDNVSNKFQKFSWLQLWISIISLINMVIHNPVMDPRIFIFVHRIICGYPYFNHAHIHITFMYIHNQNSQQIWIFII